MGSAGQVFRLLTVKAAADYLAVAPATIYSWVHQRIIPHRKHGSRLLFAEHELREFSDANKIEPLGEYSGLGSSGVASQKRGSRPVRPAPARSLKTEQNTKRKPSKPRRV